MCFWNVRYIYKRSALSVCIPRWCSHNHPCAYTSNDTFFHKNFQSNLHVTHRISSYTFYFYDYILIRNLWYKIESTVCGSAYKNIVWCAAFSYIPQWQRGRINKSKFEGAMLQGIYQGYIWLHQVQHVTVFVNDVLFLHNFNRCIFIQFEVLLHAPLKCSI